MNKEQLKSAFNETTDNAVKLLEENVELKNRIDKAIEYIEKHYTIKKEETIYMTEATKELLNILKGEDKE